MRGSVTARPLRSCVIFLLYACAAAMAWINLATNPTERLIFFLIALIFPMLGLLNFRLAWQRREREVMKEGKNVEVRLSDESVAVRSSAGLIEIPWGKVALIRSRFVWVILSTQGSWTWIPVDSMPSEFIRLFESKVFGV